MPSYGLEQTENGNKQIIITHMDALHQASPVDLPSLRVGGWAVLLPAKNHCY